jgi:hypothetical protein
MSFKSIIHGNLVTDIRALINAIYKIFQQFETPEMDIVAKRVLALSTGIAILAILYFNC